MARPSKYETHVAPRLEEVRDWCRNGATDEEIAKRLGIAYSTFKEYKNEFSAFSAVLKESKEFVDGQVENALLKRALGYSYEEITKEVDETGRKKFKTVTKQVVPDVTAQIFWLKKRRPEKWRDVNVVDATIAGENPFAGLTEKELRALANDAAKTTDSG